MTMIRNSVAATLAVVMVGVGAQSVQTALAAPANQGSPPSEAHRWHGCATHGPQMAGAPGGMFRALRKLDLSADQRMAVRSLLAAHRADLRTHFDASLIPALGNPDDPKHADAVAQAKQHAAQRIDAADALQGQVYALLTAEQKARLPTILAQMQARAAERHSRS